MKHPAEFYTLKSKKTAQTMGSTSVINKVNENVSITFNSHDHICLYSCLNIRPSSKNNIRDPFQTDTRYCFYDEPHNDYLFNDDWADFLIDNINNGSLNQEEWRNAYKNNLQIEIDGLYK